MRLNRRATNTKKVKRGKTGLPMKKPQEEEEPGINTTLSSSR